MLGRTGLASLDDLYSDVPQDVLFKGDFSIPEAMSEPEVRRRFDELASANVRLKIFAGAGACDHYSPSVIPAIISRSEYLTSYTPYQAEVSQGTLRYIFEFQTMMAELTGLDCSNASMYDGPTSAAEALMMTVACTRKKRRVLVSSTLLPQVAEVVRTYMKFHGIALDVIPESGYATDAAALGRELEAGDVAGVLVPGINRYGIIEDLSGFADAVHSAKALLAVYSDPSSLAVLKSPGEWGADIACGDAQTLGIPLNFGGPYLGFLCCRKEYVRKLPGRIAGETVDADGKRCYVLTLQAREQHIRREKASSNICSNQALCALTATVYLAAMGPDGLKNVASQCISKAHYAAKEIASVKGFELKYGGEFFNEFVTTCPICPDKLMSELEKKGILGGLPFEKDGEKLILWCVTEMNSKADIDMLVNTIKEVAE